MRYLLDSTFAIDFLRNDRVAIDRFERLVAAGDDAFVTDVVVCELATGARPQDEAGLTAFIRAVEFVQPGPEVATVAGQWRGQARRRGVTISVPDALIGAAADALEATLITRNVRDFELLPVAVEGY
jgi:predicted nucleic acid-binding protein